MAIKEIKRFNSGVNTYISELICDLETDLLNMSEMETGSTVICLENKTKYILSVAKTWVACGSSSGSSVEIPEWQELTLLNGYTGYIKIRKNALGQVECLVNIVAPDPFVGQAMTVIPEGFRPTVDETFFARRSEGGNLNIWLNVNGNFNGFASSNAGSTIKGSFVWLQE